MRFEELPYAFTRRQGLDLGLTDFRRRRFVDRGALLRARNGVYLKSAPPAPEQRGPAHVDLARAALSIYGDGFALSHMSAAAAHGLPLPLGRLDTVHLLDLSPTAKTRRAPGLVVHTSDSYASSTTFVDGVPVTTVARTAADCLREFGPRVSVPISDAALHRRLVSREQFLTEMSMQCHWRGRARADVAAALVDGRRETWLESYAFVRFAEWGVTLPQPQVEIHDEVGVFLARADGVWVEDATVLELDGRSKYLLPIDGVIDPLAALALEKTRFDRIGNLGLERVRFGLDDLIHAGGRVCSTIRMRRAAGSLARFSGQFRVPLASDLTLW